MLLRNHSQFTLQHLFKSFEPGINSASQWSSQTVAIFISLKQRGTWVCQRAEWLLVWIIICVVWKSLHMGAMLSLMPAVGTVKKIRRSLLIVCMIMIPNYRSCTHYSASSQRLHPFFSKFFEFQVHNPYREVLSEQNPMTFWNWAMFNRRSLWLKFMKQVLRSSFYSALVNADKLCFDLHEKGYPPEYWKSSKKGRSLLQRGIITEYVMGINVAHTFQCLDLKLHSL